MLPTAETPQTMAALRDFDYLPASAFVRRPVLEMLFGCSADTLARRIKAGHIPQPHKFEGGRVAYWNVGEIRATLASMTKA